MNNLPTGSATARLQARAVAFFALLSETSGIGRRRSAIGMAGMFLLLLAHASHAQDITRTWYIDNLRFDSGAVASGSFDYNTNPYNPPVGLYGTYSNIQIKVTHPSGLIRIFRRINPSSRGNECYLSMVAADPAESDLTGKPFLALTLGTEGTFENGQQVTASSPNCMTNTGGVKDILPGPANLSYIGTCRQANCGPADGPYEEAISGGRLIAGPQVWRLDNVRFDSGAVATGSLVFDDDVWTPLAGITGSYSNINIDVTSPNGSVRQFRRINPSSRGNECYVSIVAATPDVEDLTGAPFMALTLPGSTGSELTPPLPPNFDCLTNRGGVRDILPGPANLSYLGTCRQADCGPAVSPFEEAMAGGRFISNPGPKRWYLEGVTFDSGAIAVGYFDYDEYPYSPSQGLFGRFWNINIDVIGPNEGQRRRFRNVNPAARGNSQYLSLVAATGGDLTGAPFLALSLPGYPIEEAALALSPAPLSLNNLGGVRDVLPGPENLSYLGICRQANCGPADAPYEEANAGGRLVTELAPPSIVSSSSATVIEGQTSVIDVESTDNLDTEGSGLVYSKSGGADQALFNLDVNTGVVTFISAPNYDNPSDAGADNTYNLQVTVTDLGGRTAVQDMVVTVADIQAFSLRAQLSNGQTVSGEFQYVAATNQYLNINITVDDGSGTTYNVLTPGVTSNANTLSLVNGIVADLSGQATLRLTFAEPLPASGGTVDILTSVPVAGTVSALATCLNADCSTYTTPLEPLSGSVTPISSNNTWRLLGVQLADGRTLSGSFDYVAALNQYSNINIVLNDGADTTYNVLNPGIASDSDGLSLLSQVLPNMTGEQTLRFSFVQDLTDDGGTVDILTDVPFAGTVSALATCLNPDCSTYTTPLQPMSGMVTTVDATAPTANPTFAPPANAAGWHNANVTVTWNWTDNPGGSGIDPDNCPASFSFTGEGPQAAVGQCADLDGNLGLLGSGTVNIDKTAPETTVDTSPPLTTMSNDASFQFGGDDTISAIASFECQLNGAGFANCQSPINFGGIPVGDHTFDVRAIDLAGNVDPTPASYTWTVLPLDSSAPTANPSFDPPANAANWHNTDVTVSFNWTDEAGGSGIDPEKCNQTTVVSGEGANVGYGGGCVDLAGNVGQTNGFLLIDKSAPTAAITAMPPAMSSASGDATFEFSGTDAISGIAGFECTIDNGLFGIGNPCVSPHVHSTLEPGNYTFSVVAIDVAGNRQATPASYSWTVVNGCEPSLRSRLIDAPVWHLLHLPCQAPESTVFGDLFGEQVVDDEQWSAYLYDTSASPAQYKRILRGDPLPKTGFWFISQQTVTLTMPAASAAIDPADVSFCGQGRCYLQAIDSANSAWHLRGNPTGHNLDYAGMWLTNESTACQNNAPCTLDDAMSSQGIASGLFVYQSTGSYGRLGNSPGLQKVAKPWDGYWVRFDATGDGVGINHPWHLYLQRYDSQFVFVTDNTHAGDIGSVAEAHAICQAAAASAGLVGNYQAWLSDSGNAPIVSMTARDTPYLRLDGEPVATSFSALTQSDALVAPINLTASGKLVGNDRVWANTSSDGSAQSGVNHCNNWTSADSSTAGVGDPSQTNGDWTAADSAACNTNNRLYCIGGQ